MANNKKNSEVVIVDNNEVKEIVEETKKPSSNKMKVFNNSARTFFISKSSVLKAGEFLEITKEEYDKIKNFKEIKLIK